eukprot:3126150-Alexandrium_andersonii.AAC.1
MAASFGAFKPTFFASSSTLPSSALSHGATSLDGIVVPAPGCEGLARCVTVPAENRAQPRAGGD